MSCRNLATLAIAVVGLASAGCSGQSPAQPTPTLDPVRGLSVPSARSRGVESVDLSNGVRTARGTIAGTYVLTFLSQNQPVSTLPVCKPGVCPELILKAHVEGSSGAATDGTVTFQYCSLKGRPPNDITRADEAPSSACDVDGTAAWANLMRIGVNQSGDAYANFGYVQLPRTVGFRFKYSGGSSIAAGVSPSMDFTWIAQ
jgi:hypothetical protein